MSAIQAWINSKEIRHILRYMVVGASGTILDFFIFALLKTMGLPTLPANTLSYLIGMINNFS
jgi:putative flippase GtrA